MRVSKILAILILIVTLLSVQMWSSVKLMPNLTSSLALTFFLCFILILAAFKYVNKAVYTSKSWYFNLFFIWIIVTIIRSLFIVNTNKLFLTLFLTSAPSMLSIVIVYYFDNLIVFKQVVRSWLRYAPLLCLIWIPFMKISAIGNFLALFILFLLLVDLLTTKYKWYIIILSIIVIFFSYYGDNRSSVIKYSIALLLGFSLIFKDMLFYKSILKILRFTLLLIPFLFFILGISGIFNVFNMSDYISAKSELTYDTRTFLYEESIMSSKNNDYILFGRTFARGYDSFFQVNRSEQMGLKIKTDYTDRNSEVSIINIYTWLGVIGVLLYFFVFYKATQLAVLHSNNVYLQIIGVFVSFQWAYSWVENYQALDISTITLWILISLCFSKTFRSMNNTEFKQYFKSIYLM